jgi:hypothetical protein
MAPVQPFAFCMHPIHKLGKGKKGSASVQALLAIFSLYCNDTTGSSRCKGSKEKVRVGDRNMVSWSRGLGKKVGLARRGRTKGEDVCHIGCEEVRVLTSVKPMVVVVVECGSGGEAVEVGGNDKDS